MIPAFLASVTTVSEAQLALAGGADIIDCKNPALGALGWLPVQTVAEIVTAIGGRVPVSATIGDEPFEVEGIAARVASMAQSGCDYIKIGFFPEIDAGCAVSTLGALDLAHTRLIAVLLADRTPDFSLLAVLSRAGFAGVMLDTADKPGSLLEAMEPAILADFVGSARSAGLSVGLAGSLKLADIALLARLASDILGFRGALCTNHKRTASLSPEAIAAVRKEIDRAGTTHDN